MAADGRRSRLSQMSRFLRPNVYVPGSENRSSMPRATMFSVPIFLSPSTTASRVHLPPNIHIRDSRSNYSTPSDNEVMEQRHSQAQYSSISNREENQADDFPINTNSDLNSGEPFRSAFSDCSSETSTSEQTQQIANTTKCRIKKDTISKISLLKNRKVRNKARLSIAFGATLVAALVIYTVLIITGVAKDTMFHVLSISLILVLTGLLCHSLGRMFMIARQVQKSATRGTRGQRRPQHRRTRRSQRSKPRDAESIENMPTEKPIPVFMTSDEDITDMARPQGAVRHPPPVYGNYRDSRRMNPDLVHWRVVVPSPRTPSYDDAMSDVQRVVGYRPPSYFRDTRDAENFEESENVERGLADVHPLERERVQYLASQER